jgi:soluble lytic murein transglycosylase-like protein
MKLLHWQVAFVVVCLLFALFKQTETIGAQAEERAYLRARLFAEMDLRAAAEQDSEAQRQVHFAYEVEIASLRRQLETAAVDRRIARVNPRLDEATRAQIVHALYVCADRRGLDPLFALAVMEQESHYDPAAVSPKGARGLMQLMPATAADLGVPMRRIHSVYDNVCGGVKYLARHMQTYRGAQIAVLRRYYGGGAPEEYALPVLARYAKIQKEARP